ncbi:MAG TPA: BON domain-containing protein [Pyrinomonadaceae bacterium]
MKKTRIAALVAGTALAALSVGCGDAANTNTVNANRVNSNTAVVVNSNNANVANVNTSAGAYNRNYNARGDYDKDANTYKSEAKNKGESIGQGLEDGWLHFKTRAALAAVDDLRDSTINVDVDNAVITLRGDVGSAAQKAAAEKAAKGIEGQKGVKNNLAVKPAGSGTNTNAKGK